ncbi:hypothetical protein SAMN06295900_116126 [Trinickia caryophylli]|uniref:Uncharacterized protein n=1 Tax=Trinickia caryophylli TaxID=28094 RepID=A0A1X7GKY3_TRICW|nr:hypothetical protein SAMN06295900_116126 [Trinickia caryophylli]
MHLNRIGSRTRMFVRTRNHTALDTFAGSLAANGC